MAEPRKHHYLSQFYLRGFSEDERRIFQIEKSTGRVHPCNIRDAAAIRDYHELDHPDFEDPNALEKQLSQVEERLAATLRDVLHSGISGREAHAGLIEFVSLMRVRVPAQKAVIERTLEESARSVGKLLQQHGKLPAPSSPGGSIIDEVKLSILNWKVLEYMFRLAVDPDILRLLLSMRPCLHEAAEGSSFLTCDQPVALYHPEATPGDTGTGGLIGPKAEVTCPLSRRVLLKLIWPGGPAERRIASPAEVEELNRRAVIMAHTYVFTDAPSDAFMALVARYGKYSAGMEAEVVDKGDSFLHVVRNRAVMAADKYR